MMNDTRPYASTPERAAMHAACDDLIAAAADCVRAAARVMARRAPRLVRNPQETDR